MASAGKPRVLNPDPHGIAAQGCLATLCLGCLSWPEQELGRGTDSASRQPRGESKGFPGAGAALPGLAPAVPGQSLQDQTCRWRQEPDPGKRGPKRALVLHLHFMLSALESLAALG